MSDPVAGPKYPVSKHLFWVTRRLSVSDGIPLESERESPLNPELYHQVSLYCNMPQSPFIRPSRSRRLGFI